ncbi:hypothetical protein AOLI_G00106610 [Acnodon oligacanthus]
MQKRKEHTVINPLKNLEDYICQKHRRPLELFCRDDQMSACVICTLTDHKKHNTVPVEEGIGEMKSQLEKIQSERNTDREKVDSVEVFTALIRSIERSQAELLEVMEEKQKATERQAEDLIRELEQEITELKKRDSELEQLSHTEDHLHLLQIYPSLCRPPHTKNWTDISTGHHLRVETVRNALSGLQRSLDEMIIESELKMIQQYPVDVTRDADTAHPKLILSDSGKQMTHRHKTETS